jgi:uncharacterized membrane protein YphA (DoxX/SURF4 family)
MHWKDLKTGIPTTVLILLWTYTGLEKLLDFKSNSKAFHNQVFPSEIAEILAYAIPIIELVLAILLIFKIIRWWAFMGSLLLLSVFSTYIGLIWIEAFPRVPCSCAGIIAQLGWGQHLILNLVLIAMSGWGLGLSSPLLKNKGRDAVESLPKF